MRHRLLARLAAVAAVARKARLQPRRSAARVATVRIGTRRTAQAAAVAVDVISRIPLDRQAALAGITALAVAAVVAGRYHLPLAALVLKASSSSNICRI